MKISKVHVNERLCFSFERLTEDAPEALSLEKQFLHIKRSQATAKSPRNIHKNAKQEHAWITAL